MFVGRVSELAWLRERVAGGRGGLVMVSGPPGAGKTSLVRHAIGERPHLWTRTWELGDAPALWPIAQLLRLLQRRSPAALEPDAARLGALLTGGGEGASAFALYQAVTDSVLRAADEAPIVIVLDDIHGADRSTLELLLVAEPIWRNAPVLILGTRRTVDARNDPATTTLLARLTQLSEERVIGGLEPDALRALAEGLAGRSVTDSEVAALLERAGGLPLFVEGLVHGAGGAPIGGLDGVPSSIQALVADRVNQLPAEVGAVLRYAALVPGRLDAALLAVAVGQPLPAVERAFEHAITEGLLCRHANGVSWAHQVYAEALAGSMTTAALRDGHLALLQALDALGVVSVTARVRHAVEAGHPDAVRWLMDAGRESEALYAFAAAADHYAGAVRIARAVEARSDALVARARAQVRAGDRDGARASLDVARRLDVASRRPAVACAWADTVPFAIGDEDGVVLLERALGEVGHAQPGVRSGLLSRLATLKLEADPDQPGIEDLLSEAIGAAVRSGDRRTELDALVAALRYWRDDRLTRRVALVRKLEALRGGLDHARDRLEVARWGFNTALECCDGTWARTALGAYERAATTLRTPMAQLNVALRRATLCQLEGRYDAVDGDQILELGLQADDPHARYFSVSCRAMHAVIRGDRDALERWTPIVEEGTRAWAQHPGVLLQSVWLKHHLGRAAEVEVSYGLWRADGFRKTPWWGHLQGLAILSDIAVGQGQREDAELLAEVVAEYPEGYAGCGPTLPFGPLARFEAKLLRFLGRDAAADAATERALALCARLGAPGSAALIRQEQAAARRRVSSGPTLRALMVDEGDVWRFTLGTREIRLKATTGWRHVAAIVERAEPVSVLDLTSAGRSVRLDGDTGAVLDESARDAYAMRARALYDEISEAESFNDYTRAARLQAELEQLTDELARATGLGGRSRKAGGAAERARTSVKQAIRRAIAALKPELPELAEHFERGIRTGLECTYQPEVRGLRVDVRRSRN